MKHFAIAVLAILFGLSGARAAQISSFSPQGVIAQVRSVQASFDRDVIALGNHQAAAPFVIRCDGQKPAGAGRWLDTRHWVYEFNRPPPAGVSCTALVAPDFRDLDGQGLEGPSQYSFTTGGPRARVRAPVMSTINEDQVFVLVFNADVQAASVGEHAQCLVQGLGEAVPVRMITGALRHQLLEATSMDDSPSVQLVQCKRTLPPNAKVQLWIQPGVRTLAVPGRDSVAGVRSDVFKYTVRKAFTAEMGCIRENAQAACSPAGTISLKFSAAVSHDILAQVLLETPTGPIRPAELDPDSGSAGTTLNFEGAFPADSVLTLVLPEDLHDEAGRSLANAARFPLTVRTAEYPPLIKFPSGTFGIIERFASDPQKSGRQPPMLPLSIRHVETDLAAKELSLSAGTARDYVVADDVHALHWLARVQRLDDRRLTARQIEDVRASRPLSDAGDEPVHIDTRSVSILSDAPSATSMTLPGVDPEHELEVIGVPLARPGLHILEVESPRLGASLLGQPPRPMYVRTAALVTNLAVHIKTGRDDLLVWVTSLEDGQPVAGATLAVLSCSGTLLAQGTTDAKGIWHTLQRPEFPDYCPETELRGLFVTARIPADHPQAGGQADFSFALSDWDRGIEAWRFNVPTDTSPVPDLAVHGVFDRTLLHAGETVSMKFFARTLTREGMENPKTSRLPVQAHIQHQGSDDAYDLDLEWSLSPSGGQFALASLALPSHAKLGTYDVTLLGREGSGGPYWGGAPSYDAGSFRVESFKLPLLTGSLKVTDPAGHGMLVAPTEAVVDVQLAYVSGGAAGKLPVTISVLARDRTVSFNEYDDYRFGVPASVREGLYDEPDDADAEAPARSLIVDQQAVTLDAQGGARTQLTGLTPAAWPQSWLVEAGFSDPNGRIQTIAGQARVWPANVVAGIRGGDWLTAGRSATVSLLALDLQGKPAAGVPMQLDAKLRTTYSTRKRLVGGFYSYDSYTKLSELGTLCEGTTDDQGKLACEITLEHEGLIELYAQAQDAQGRHSIAWSSIWVAGGEAWFGGHDDDRIDVIPSKKIWAPGETAEFQVRMPFRHASALVAVEREGVLETHVVELEGDHPVVRLPVKAGWGPNVYVSVLAVRGRIRHVPWSSLFSWGWKQPFDWYRAWSTQAKHVPQPTGLVDLARPAFRFGLARIEVSDGSDALDVQVSTERSSYQVRETAKVTVAVKLPDGTPAAHGSIAFVAVDEALLELWKNDSWNVLDAMRMPRSYGVSTASAQGEVVGRRHYGRKAVPAGGGGGFGPTRELLDTLLLWRGDLTLDEQGETTIEVPLNDSLTRFRLVAVADFGAGRFGSGYTDIVSTQDLQVIPGVPLSVRSGDTYEAQITVRNRTTRAMDLKVTAEVLGNGIDAPDLAPQAVQVAAGASRRVVWEVTAPEGSDKPGGEVLNWTFGAIEQAASIGTPASDRIVVPQHLIPAVPLEVRQATVAGFAANHPLVLPVQPSAAALQKPNGEVRGGVSVTVQPSLAGGLSGVRDWFAAYPYTCLEQSWSRFMGLRNHEDWEALMLRLPTYIDEQGLAAYFPGGKGSVPLTAYLLSAGAQAQALGWGLAIPDESREQMANGLIGFIQGRFDVDAWAPYQDRGWRLLIAMEAISRLGLFKASMLDTLVIDENQWSSAKLVDWALILTRQPDIPSRDVHLAKVKQVLRARLSRHGTELVLDDATVNDGWWLMLNRETVQARLLEVMLGQPDWRDDVPALALGLLHMQRRGAWSTTTANLLSTLAIAGFAKEFDQAADTGRVSVSLSDGARAVQAEWAGMEQVDGVRQQEFFMPWSGTGADQLRVEQLGAGHGWATVQVRSAEADTQPVDSGMTVTRSVTPVRQARPGQWSVGDIYRVELNITARGHTVWAVLSDPIPAGAVILGSGLGRDSAIAVQDERNSKGRSPSFVERREDVFRAYYEVLDPGRTRVEYTVRLNTPGTFQLSPTRVEGMYQPDVFGTMPNAPLTVGGGQ
ncbi:MAG: MG2 domain-containing protein [Alcaligenaceae bacterium]|nr:MG2 domain-containing protein [Alcaligenaceae bacterium]